MEWAQAGKRGLFASWLQMSLPLGGLIANLALGEASLVTGAAFMTWSWRIPFALSLLLVAVGLYIRFGLEETPVFRKVLSEKRVEKLPVLEALRRTWRQILLTTLLCMSELASYVVYGVFVFAIGVQMLYGSQGALIAENFPARIRYSGSSIGYQLAHRGRRLGSLHCNRTAGPGPQWLSGRRLLASVLCH